jgi:hypothetical protein
MQALPTAVARLIHLSHARANKLFTHDQGQRVSSSTSCVMKPSVRTIAVASTAGYLQPGASETVRQRQRTPTRQRRTEHNARPS